jgi:hypothetical protein
MERLMNVGELIEQLSKYPKDVPVCVDNNPIYFTDMTGAYWNGRLNQIVHDEEKKSHEYSIIGWKITSKGYKVVLNVMELEDVMQNNPDIPVEYDLEAHSVDRYRDSVEQTRREIKEMIARVDARIAKDKAAKK